MENARRIRPDHRRAHKRGRGFAVPSLPYQIVGSNVDWLTITRKGEPGDDTLRDLSRAIHRTEAQTDPKIVEWRWRGYEGMRGDNFAYGRRWDTDILQLSGQIADDWFTTLTGDGMKCTRIDLAVTVQFDKVTEGVANECHSLGCREDRKHERKPNRSLIVNNQGGSTAYIGDRASALFARCYDKWRERLDDRYERCWRWEVECKAEPAALVVERLRSSPDRQRSILDLVSTHFTRRGAPHGWMAGRGGMHISTTRAPSTVNSRLKWLSDAVAPVIRRLLPLVGSQELLLCVGLDEDSVRLYKDWKPGTLGGHDVL